jgi:hypothetical protein
MNVIETIIFFVYLIIILIIVLSILSNFFEFSCASDKDVKKKNSTGSSEAQPGKLSDQSIFPNNSAHSRQNSQLKTVTVSSVSSVSSARRYSGRSSSNRRSYTQKRSYSKSYRSSYHQPKTYIDSNGYRRFCDSDILVHRYVAAKKLGRKLRPGEVVHHKNRNKLDNSAENLWVFRNQYEHNKAHRYDSKRYGRW